MRSAHLRRVILLGGAMVVPMAHVAAQTDAAGHARASAQPAFYFGVNVAIGATAGVAHALAHRAPLWPALWGGMAGGATTYLGMRGIGSTRAPVRMLGLQGAALGANMTRNAGRGVGLFSDITLPVWPVYVRFGPAGPTGSRRPTVRLSAGAIGAMVHYARHPHYDLTFDWQQTVLHGVPIFRSSRLFEYPTGAPSAACVTHACPGSLRGQAAFGTLFYTTGRSPTYTEQDVLRHELVHVAQFTRDAVLFGAPISDATLQRLGRPGALLARVVVIDVARPLWLASHLAGPAGGDAATRYLELEADAMRRQDRCRVREEACRW